MSAIDIFQIARFQIQDTKPCGHKHTRIISLAQLVICRGKHLIRRKSGFRQTLYQCFRRHHEHCRRNSFAGYIRNEKCQSVFPNKIEIIEISTDFFCRHHIRINIKIRPVWIGRKYTRQGGMLDCFCKFQFLIDPGSRLFDITFQGNHRGINIIGQGRKFLITSYIHHDIKISSCDLCQGFIYLPYIIHDESFYQIVNQNK